MNMGSFSLGDVVTPTSNANLIYLLIIISHIVENESLSNKIVQGQQE